MSVAEKLFGDKAMGYTAKEPQLSGFSGSLKGEGERITSSVLPGMEWDLSRMTGGARRHRHRKTRRGGRRTQRGGRRRTTKRGTKSFLNIRVTGRIRMKQRHRQ